MSYTYKGLPPFQFGTFIFFKKIKFKYQYLNQFNWSYLNIPVEFPMGTHIYFEYFFL